MANHGGRSLWNSFSISDVRTMSSCIFGSFFWATVVLHKSEHSLTRQSIKKLSSGTERIPVNSFSTVSSNSFGACGIFGTLFVTNIDSSGGYYCWTFGSRCRIQVNMRTVASRWNRPFPTSTILWPSKWPWGISVFLYANTFMRTKTNKMKLK